LYGVIVALRLLHDVPSEHSMEQAMEMLIQNHTLGKRSARHLTGALEKVVKYRMLAQLKNKSGNEYLYHKGVSNKPVGAWEISGKYLEKVMEIYSTVLPVVIGADDYFHSNVLTKNTFNLENLKLETPWIRLLGLQRMGLDEEGLKECIALSEGQSFSMQRIVSVAENLSNTRVAMGDYNGAIVDLGMLKEVCLDQKSRKTIAAVDGKLSVVVNLAGQVRTLWIVRFVVFYFLLFVLGRSGCILATRRVVLYGCVANCKARSRLSHHQRRMSLAFTWPKRRGDGNFSCCAETGFVLVVVV
jgi:hypothetical protein